MAVAASGISYDQAVGLAQRTLRALGTVAEQLERGQADVPLQQHLRALEGELREPHLTFTVLTLDPSVLGALATWLCGEENEGFVRAAQSGTGVLELSFHERGYFLEVPGARAESYDSLTDLFGALERRAEGATSPASDAIRLSLPAAGGLHGVRIFLILAMEPLNQDLRVATRIMRASNLLWLVGGERYRFDSSASEAVSPLLGGMDHVLPIVIRDESAVGTAPAQGWWSGPPLLGHSRARPLFLGPAPVPPLPAVVTDARNDARRALVLMHFQRRLRQALDVVVERLETLRQQQKTRRSKEERAERATSEGSADTLVRGPIEAMKSGLSDDIALLQRRIQESSRRSLGQEGTLATAVNKIVQSLSTRDLIQSPGLKSIALTLDDMFTSRAARELRQVFKEKLREDLASLREGLEACKQNAQKRLSGDLAIGMPLDLQPPDEEPIREALRDVIQVQLKYRGEIPRRGFLQRLAEGKRLLFTVIMVITLFGGLLTGGNVRAALAPFGIAFVALFVIGVLWTYRSWEKEDAERMDKEIDKVREQLLSEAMRLAREGERERLTRLNEAIELVRKEGMRRVEEFGRQLSQQATVMHSRERAGVKERIRVIEQRSRELDGLRNSLQRAEQDCGDLTRQSEALLRQALAAP